MLNVNRVILQVGDMNQISQREEKEVKRKGNLKGELEKKFNQKVKKEGAYL